MNRHYRQLKQFLQPERMHAAVQYKNFKNILKITVELLNSDKRQSDYRVILLWVGLLSVALSTTIADNYMYAYDKSLVKIFAI